MKAFLRDGQGAIFGSLADMPFLSLGKWHLFQGCLVPCGLYVSSIPCWRGPDQGPCQKMAEALKGSQTSRCVVDDGLAVAASAHPASCGDLHGVVACAVGVDVHPYPVPLDGCPNVVTSNEDGMYIESQGWTFWVWAWSCLLGRQ